jgi:CheY-like chemotaxis protein
MQQNKGLAPVLVVDDRWEDIFLTQRLLRATRTKHPIHSATGGAEAIDYLQRCFTDSTLIPCVIFLDTDMPMTSGLHVLQWVREQEVFKNVVIVMLSDSEEPADIELAYEMGAHSHLTKFPSSKTLAEILEQANLPVGPRQKLPAHLRTAPR